MTKYIGICTPKCMRMIEDGDFTIPDEYSDIELIFDTWIYADLLDPNCTEEILDQKIYIVERDWLENQKPVAFSKIRF